jgi:hypothetical protein
VVLIAGLTCRIRHSDNSWTNYLTKYNKNNILKINNLKVCL